MQILDTFCKTKSERQYMFWVSDHRRTSIRLLLFNKTALFSFELSRCVFSVQSFAEHYTAFTSRYSSNCTFQVMQPSLMWLPVMIPGFDGSLFPHLAVAPWSNTVSGGGNCAALCPSFATVLFHWAQPVDVLIAKGVSFDFENLLLHECLGVFSALFRFVHYSFKLLLWALLKQISERKCQSAQTGNWK